MLCIFSSFFVSRDVRAARMLVRRELTFFEVLNIIPFTILFHLGFSMKANFRLKGISFSAPGNFLPELLCTALVAALHIWKRNTLLSIAAGTVAYMLLVQLVF